MKSCIWRTTRWFSWLSLVTPRSQWRVSIPMRWQTSRCLSTCQPSSSSSTSYQSGHSSLELCVHLGDNTWSTSFKTRRRRGSSLMRKTRRKRPFWWQMHGFRSSWGTLIILVSLTSFIHLESPGTGIFLIKERAKLYKATSARKVHTLGRRLNQTSTTDEEQKQNQPGSDKRINMGGG